MTNRKKINFSVILDNINYPIETYTHEYPNLMFLLRDQLLLDDFGECGGVGRCASCIIKIEGIKEDSSIKERNEGTTLSKMGFTDEAIRLSCQLYINDAIDGAHIEIVEV